ncbi:hypothetical protein [Chlorogloea sp. CCALA 695]|uniref:hypothetical protein n=1 Tax=Chlorogloea sp. CCALA 695 TaxID=2107693 RepID=UPI000D06F822|nr:hypothetical protein [Chlorogloea sp. CCALA 695]PSB24507.1 hypothetical protein C7B70_25365 [Chlorogloea sp. CCALA 695]
MFTPTEQTVLSKLPQEVQRILKDYPTVVENYLMARSLPVLAQSNELGLFEIYYDCADIPAMAIKKGVLTTNKINGDTPPTIIEGMGDDGAVFIQVGDCVILNRVGGHFPEVRSVLVEVG